MKNIYTLKKDILAVGRRVYERGYVASNDGNISAKIDENRILITPTGVSKGFMEADDLVIIDYNGKVLNGAKKPSSEYSMHVKMYQERADVNGVCHAHPPYATGFAVAGIPLDQCVLPEVIVALGGIPIAEYGLPGTDKLFEPVLKYVQTHDAFLLENHGALTIGKDVLNAYHKMETMEHFAHILFVSRMLGNVNTLSREHVGDLVGLREKFGITTGGSCAIDSDPKDDGPSSPLNNQIDEDALVEQITNSVLKHLKT
ncbi:MAG: class II aldolase/adducin family protein [Calditrichaeota bacterium]|nr:MAG: class II aldolase/adducin family protein [Calditrichota bacterium]